MLNITEKFMKWEMRPLARLLQVNSTNSTPLPLVSHGPQNALDQNVAS
jgi:hypothetical protein